jgi:hypothetical protein
MIQERVNRLPSASQAAFSPDGPADDAAGQRKPQGAGAHRRRRN